MAKVAGIDIGSVFSKALLMEGGKVLSFHSIPSGGNYRIAAEEALAQALDKAEVSPQDIACIATTGYGAALFPSNLRLTDISCEGKGIHYLFPSARTVIDIGGQFTKVTGIDEEGNPVGFATSERCAAGSGRFLQLIARVLQIDFKDIGPLSLQAKGEVKFTTNCAVFVESEVISRIAEGATKEDILAGVHEALAAKILSLVDRVGLKRDCVITGGGAKDIGLVKSLEEKLGFDLLVPEEPQITAALGAALIAWEKLS